jgi:zinc finger BED domain-containing protein 1 (E3 SUMO-protein ligase ZBED1)
MSKVTMKQVSDDLLVASKNFRDFQSESKACKDLKGAQRVLGLPEHMLIQDEPTRWNSTYNMFNRLLEQQKAVVVVMPDLKISNDFNFSASDWKNFEF